MPTSRAPPPVMSHSRALAFLLATLLAAPFVQAQIGIQPIPDQDIPSGKTLVVPIPATDPGGPARSYTVTVGPPSTTSTTAGIVATIRTGDPHFTLGVSYTDSNSVMQTGTMEFQLLREFSPVTTKIIGGLAEGGFYSPSEVSGSTKYITFHRVVAGYIIQGGDPNGDGSGGPGFSFENEFSSSLIFSATAGQLAMANSGNGAAKDINGTNGSQFFVTLASERRYDYSYTIFGQLLRGYDTLFGIAGTPVQDNGMGEESSPINPVDITSAAISQNDTDAVLLLSATGVCDATITVTASSGASTAVQTFTAHAVSDTVSDPPFLRPVPDATAPDGNFKLPLQGTDLQLDLLRYGYQRLLPVMDVTVTSGTSPLITVPLISNTDNVIAATLDHWNPSFRGNDLRVFDVGAGDKPLRGTLNPAPQSVVTTATLSAYSVAVFTAGNTKDKAASFTASVNWGDGTLLSGSNLSIIKDTSARTVNRYRLVAAHTYTAPGEYPLIVKVADPGGAHLLLTGTANISASPMSLSGEEIFNTGGKIKNKVLATMSDSSASATASDYSATIDWGDGSVSPGVVKSIGKGSYHILGSHVYQAPGTFTLSTSVSRGGASAYSAWEWSSAHVAGVSAPQVFPPFSQAHLAQIWSAIISATNPIVTSSNQFGAFPYAPLIQGTDGYFYGTASQGGQNNGYTGGYGTAFQLSTSGSIALLHAFTDGSDGANPYSALVQASDGNFYGTTETGGSGGAGTVFQITASGSLTTLYSFTGGADGGNPYSPLIQGTDGNLYGTTEGGGADGDGVIFKIMPGNTPNTPVTLYSFTGGDDGANPYSPVLEASDGNLYGTTESGGSGGYGTVYVIATTGTAPTTLHAFTSGTDGATPFAGVIQGTDGNLYGTTEGGGADSAGTVYQISTSGLLYNQLYSFTGGNDGGYPYGVLVQANDGNLYGTTEGGGSSGDGALFQITTGGSFSPLYSFTDGSDGEDPYAGLVQGTDDNLYGTTESGGSGGGGTVFYIPTGNSPVTPATLYSFATPTSQVAVTASVAIINSGNERSAAGSFSVYVDANGTIDGNQTLLTSEGKGSFPIPALDPGQYVVIPFIQQGSVVDSRLYLPVSFNASGQQIVGVVTYSDPVGDFDGSQKIVAPGFTF